jgi:hypothetical protein
MKSDTVSVKLTRYEIALIAQLLVSGLACDMPDKLMKGSDDDPEIVLAAWKKHSPQYAEECVRQASLPGPPNGNVQDFADDRAQHDAEAALLGKLIPHLPAAVLA